MEAEGPPDMAVFSDNDYTDGYAFRFTLRPGCANLDCEDLICSFTMARSVSRQTLREVFLFAGNDDALDLLVVGYRCLL